MTLSQSAVSDLLEAFRASEGVDLVRESVRLVLQELIETEATAVIGAARYERGPDRVTERNGTRTRELLTRAARWKSPSPSCGPGSFFPSVLEPRRKIDQARYAVVMERHVNGVSARNVDALVVTLGGSRISKSEVSRNCGALDEEVGMFRTRRLGWDRASVPVPGRHLSPRPRQGLVASKAVLVATAVTAEGRGETSAWMSATGRTRTSGAAS
jgi:putative transposase